MTEPFDLEAVRLEATFSGRFGNVAGYMLRACVAEIERLQAVQIQRDAEWIGHLCDSQSEVVALRAALERIERSLAATYCADHPALMLARAALLDCPERSSHPDVPQPATPVMAQDDETLPQGLRDTIRRGLVVPATPVR